MHFVRLKMYEFDKDMDTVEFSRGILGSDAMLPPY
jgi:hypothetical protein